VTVVAIPRNPADGPQYNMGGGKNNARIKKMDRNSEFTSQNLVSTAFRLTKGGPSRIYRNI